MLSNRFSRSIVRSLLVGLILTSAVVGTFASRGAAQAAQPSTLAVGDVIITYPGSWVVLSPHRSIETMLAELQARNPTRSRDYVQTMLAFLQGHEGAIAVDAMTGSNVFVVRRGDSFKSRFTGSTRKQCKSLATEGAKVGLAQERCTATTVGGKPAYRADSTYGRQFLTASIYFGHPITGRTIAATVTCNLNAAGRALVDAILASTQVG
jgi:hypothetical protein